MSTYAFCTNCGKEAAPGSLFCAGCGWTLTKPGQAVPPVVVAPAVVAVMTPPPSTEQAAAQADSVPTTPLPVEEGFQHNEAQLQHDGVFVEPNGGAEVPEGPQVSRYPCPKCKKVFSVSPGTAKCACPFCGFRVIFVLCPRCDRLFSFKGEDVKQLKVFDTPLKQQLWRCPSCKQKHRVVKTLGAVPVVEGGKSQ